MITLRQLLEDMVQRKASDLHITAGVPPEFRVDGVDHADASTTSLTPELTAQLAYSVLSRRAAKRFETTKELDFSFGIKGLSRFRANVFLQRGVVADGDPPDPVRDPGVREARACRRSCASFTEPPQGPGPGHRPDRQRQVDDAGRDDRQDQRRRGRPHHHDRGPDRVHPPAQAAASSTSARSTPTPSSFATALKYVLRQDPDVILIGEMRDLETIAAALTIAETGHLVFATLHTNSTFESINRIVDVVPADQQKQIRTQLAFVLEGVVTQQLIPRSRGRGPGHGRRRCWSARRPSRPSSARARRTRSTASCRPGRSTACRP